MDDTYVKVAGEWKYLYRGVNKLGQTVDFLLTARRSATKPRPGVSLSTPLISTISPEFITIDKSGANTAAVRSLVSDSEIGTKLRQSKYLNNLVGWATAQSPPGSRKKDMTTTFEEACAVLQRHAATSRDQKEPAIDELLPIVTESVVAFDVCKTRIDAVEKALEAALKGEAPSS